MQGLDPQLLVLGGAVASLAGVVYRLLQGRVSELKEEIDQWKQIAENEAKGKAEAVEALAQIGGTTAGHRAKEGA